MCAKGQGYLGRCGLKAQHRPHRRESRHETVKDEVIPSKQKKLLGRRE